MRKFPEEHPSFYHEFKKGKFVVKTSSGYFKGVSPDMKLEQTVQRSQKSASGIIGQTKKMSYVTEWELIYHEILAISNLHAEVMNLKRHFAEHNLYHHELRGNNIIEYNEAVKKLIDFILPRGNPFSASANVKLYHFTSNQIMPLSKSSKILNCLEHGKSEYEQFRKERYIDKEKKLSATIKRVSLPTLQLKKTKR